MYHEFQKIADKIKLKLTLKIEKMKKQENETNEKNLNEFLEYCREQIDFVEIQTYVNSVKVHFEKSILTNVFVKLNAINYQYFVFSSQISDYNTIVLFIYKKKCYEFN